MRITYISPSLTTVSGGTRKLAHHVDILQRHGFDAQLVQVPLNVKPHLNTTPDNLVVVPEVYGDGLTTMLDSGVPRVYFSQNAYLVPENMSAHLENPDVVAVLTESDHSTDVMGKRFPNLTAPILRTHSCGNTKGLFSYGEWPREKWVMYFGYKNKHLIPRLMAGLSLPGWKAIALSGTDEEVAESLRRGAIFLAPLTNEGMCATTSEAMISGAAIVGWPGGPSIHPAQGYPRAIGETRQHVVGGPMEYLDGRAWIVDQDDITALQGAVMAQGHLIEENWREVADATAEFSRWFQAAYSREQEEAELVTVMEMLCA